MVCLCWFEAGYVSNKIFTDGHTFRESRSIDYDHKIIGLTAGMAYSWNSQSLTYSVNDSNFIQSSDDKAPLDNISQYGTLTFLWRR
jgi:hypothetical protein